MQAQIKDLDQKLSILAEEPARYSDLKKNFEMVEKKRKSTSDEIRVTEASLNGLTKLVQHEEAWTKLIQIEREMVGLAHARNFPVDGILRLNQRLKDVETPKIALRKQRTKLQQLTATLEGSES